MILGIQLIGIIFALLMIYLTFLFYKKNNYSTKSFVMWMIVWVLFLIATIFPRTLYGVMEELHLERTVDFFIIIGFMFFTIIIFYLYATIKKLEQKIEVVVRKTAIENVKKPRINKTKNKQNQE